MNLTCHCVTHCIPFRTHRLHLPLGSNGGRSHFDVSVSDIRNDGRYRRVQNTHPNSEAPAVVASHRSTANAAVDIDIIGCLYDPARAHCEGTSELIVNEFEPSSCIYIQETLFSAFKHYWRDIPLDVRVTCGYISDAMKVKEMHIRLYMYAVDSLSISTSCSFPCVYARPYVSWGRTPPSYVHRFERAQSTLYNMVLLKLDSSECV